MEETKGHTVLEDLRLASKVFTGNGIGATDLDMQWIKSKELNRWGREVCSSQGTGRLIREEAVSSPLHYLLWVTDTLSSMWDDSSQKLQNFYKHEQTKQLLDSPRYPMVYL